MKKNQFIATAVLLLAAGTANSAQIHSENAVPSPDRTAAIRLQSAPDSQPVYEPDKVDVKASFPGGEIKQMEFLTKNLKFPEEALKEKVAGKIVIQFIVETDGSLTHMEVSSPLHPACDTEALRVIKQMPRWTPAQMKGKAVRSRITLPMQFRYR